MAFKFKTFAAAVGSPSDRPALVEVRMKKDPNHIKVGVIVGAPTAGCRSRAESCEKQ